jgi:rhamnulokinase
MAAALNFLALDLGAESGRVMTGKYDGGRLGISEAHRFASLPVRLPDGLHTDVLRIWSELKYGMALAGRSAGGDVAGIGVDTWGVDFALLDRQGSLLSNPYHYRDNLTEGILPKAFKRVPRAEIFNVTGLQFMPINTLYQLFALKLRGSPLIHSARRLLMMPDLFNCWLSGERANEFCIASTSQCFDLRKKTWAKPMLRKFGLPTHIFGKTVQPGSLIGGLLPEGAEETGLRKGVPVIAPGCHDTALAVAAVPAQNRDFAYISCGTWSVLGAELPEPCITAQSLAADFTNEGGVGGTFRFLKNLTGLWLVQESRREWLRKGEDSSYAELTRMAAEATPFRSIINPASGEFGRPGDMPERIRDYCRRSGQPAPESKGAVVRCALESLALSYRQTLGQLEGILGRSLNPIHIVGGGTKNGLLCQFAADATGRTVVGGPVEATAIGNVLMQAVALGEVGSVEQGRELVRRSFQTAVYEPRSFGAWDDAYARFINLKG